MLNGATTFSKTTLGIMTISIMGLFMTHGINDDIKLNDTRVFATFSKHDTMHKRHSAYQY